MAKHGAASRAGGTPRRRNEAEHGASVPLQPVEGRGAQPDEGPLALDRLTFNDLKALLRTTDGNLSVHARKLEEAEYVECLKSFEGRVPKTEYRITSAGRRALERYLDHMEALIRATRER